MVHEIETVENTGHKASPSLNCFKWEMDQVCVHIMNSMNMCLVYENMFYAAWLHHYFLGEIVAEGWLHFVHTITGTVMEVRILKT